MSVSCFSLDILVKTIINVLNVSAFHSKLRSLLNIIIDRLLINHKFKKYSETRVIQQTLGGKFNVWIDRQGVRLHSV